jgi:hypothetical protein
LRDKHLKYPRIVAGLDHPPLQESEFGLIVQQAKEIRDAVVHASPAPIPGTQTLRKETAAFDIEPSLVERIVDGAVTLVRKLECEWR